MSHIAKPGTEETWCGRPQDGTSWPIAQDACADCLVSAANRGHDLTKNASRDPVFVDVSVLEARIRGKLANEQRDSERRRVVREAFAREQEVNDRTQAVAIAVSARIRGEVTREFTEKLAEIDVEITHPDNARFSLRNLRKSDVETSEAVDAAAKRGRREGMRDACAALRFDTAALFDTFASQEIK